MRLLADENVANSVVIGLRQDGHEIVSVRDRMPGSSDEDVMRFARKSRRLIITHDLDFANVKHFPVLRNTGVIVVRLKNSAPSVVSDWLRFVLSALSEKDLLHRLTIVSEKRIRQFTA